MAIDEYTKPKLNAILQFIQATKSKNNSVMTGTDPIRCSERRVLGFVHYLTKFIF